MSALVTMANTWNVWDRQTCGPTPQIVETDIWFCSDCVVTLGNPPCNDSSWAMRALMMHEMGHSLGLQHITSVLPAMGVMMTNQGLGVKYCGTTTERVWLGPDDVAGGIFLYPTSGTTRDLAGSPFEWNGTNSTSFVDCPGCPTPCINKGQLFTIEWTTMNLGNQNVSSYDIRFYLSSNTTITTSDTNLGTNTGASLSATQYATFQRNLTMPTTVASGSVWWVGTWLPCRRAVPAMAAG